jgi:hypothetical protein
MHTLLHILGAILVIAFLAAIFLIAAPNALRLALLTSRFVPRGLKIVIACNDLAGLGAEWLGQFDRSYTPGDTGITSRWQVVKQGASPGLIVLAAATSDVPLGIVTDQFTTGDSSPYLPLRVKPFGAGGFGVGVAGTGVTVTENAAIYSKGDGTFMLEPAVAGTYFLCGYALTAAAAGGKFAFRSIVPIKLTVLAELAVGTTVAGSDAGTTQTCANACRTDLLAIRTACATPTLLKLL